eukprot:scaffold76016_cov51-Attheya_sp.AAC.1
MMDGVFQRVEGGTKKATNPKVSPTCSHGLASVDALVGDILFLLERAVRQGCRIRFECLA